MSASSRSVVSGLPGRFRLDFPDLFPVISLHLIFHLLFNMYLFFASFSSCCSLFLLGILGFWAQLYCGVQCIVFLSINIYFSIHFLMSQTRIYYLCYQLKIIVYQCNASGAKYNANILSVNICLMNCVFIS